MLNSLSRVWVENGDSRRWVIRQHSIAPPWLRRQRPAARHRSRRARRQSRWSRRRAATAACVLPRQACCCCCCDDELAAPPPERSIRSTSNRCTLMSCCARRSRRAGRLSRIRFRADRRIGLDPRGHLALVDLDFDVQRTEVGRAEPQADAAALAAEVLECLLDALHETHAVGLRETGFRAICGDGGGGRRAVHRRGHRQGAEALAAPPCAEPVLALPLGPGDARASTAEAARCWRASWAISSGAVAVATAAAAVLSCSATFAAASGAAGGGVCTPAVAVLADGVATAIGELPVDAAASAPEVVVAAVAEVFGMIPAAGSRQGRCGRGTLAACLSSGRLGTFRRRLTRRGRSLREVALCGCIRRAGGSRLCGQGCRGGLCDLVRRGRSVGLLRGRCWTAAVLLCGVGCRRCRRTDLENYRRGLVLLRLVGTVLLRICGRLTGVLFGRGAVGRRLFSTVAAFGRRRVAVGRARLRRSLRRLRASPLPAPRNCRAFEIDSGQPAAIGSDSRGWNPSATLRPKKTKPDRPAARRSLPATASVVPAPAANSRRTRRRRRTPTRRAGTPPPSRAGRSVEYICGIASMLIGDISRALGRLKFLCGLVDQIGGGLALADVVQHRADLFHVRVRFELGDDFGPFAVGHSCQHLGDDVGLAFFQQLLD